jgi:arginase family enzyme
MKSMTRAAINWRIIGKQVSVKAYLTFDIDCLDPSTPRNGTPIPGG